jgi:class 3 adenylate cyclase
LSFFIFDERCFFHTLHNEKNTFSVFNVVLFQHYSFAQDRHIIDSLEDKLKNLEASQQEMFLKSQQQIEKSNRSLTLGITFGMGGALLGILSLAIIFYWQRNKITREKKISEEERLKTEAAKKQSEELLLNILPAEVAEEIKTTGTAKAKSFTMVTVMFTDFKDFTSVSEHVSAELLVDEIHTCFSAFDRIVQKHKVEKIKTIGDAYLCASGLPVSNYTHAVDMLHAAFEIRSFMLQRKKEKEARGEIPFELRIGIHTGPVVAGIVGIRKYAYDIWGIL